MLDSELIEHDRQGYRTRAGQAVLLIVGGIGAGLAVLVAVLFVLAWWVR